MAVAVLLLALAAALSGAARGAAAAKNGTVAILSTSVQPGAPGFDLASAEQAQAQAAGFAVDLIKPDDWKKKSAADFAQYRLILVGDNCGPTGDVSAAIETAATWGSAVDGNVVVLGTAPALAYQLGGGIGPLFLILDAIRYATASPDATGAYVSLGCAFKSAPAGTAVPLLAGLGSFSITGFPAPPCPSDATVVGTAASFGDVTDVRLSGWPAAACSVRQIFGAYPSTFSRLAETGGAPYILLRGENAAAGAIALTQAADAATVGQDHALTASAAAVGLPVTGASVTFTVLSGPNAGLTADAVTDLAGNAQWAYSSAVAGTDTIVASFVDGGSMQRWSNTVDVTWSAAPVDTTPPETFIDTHPSDPSSSSSAELGFSASEAGSTFSCALDTAALAACVSPVTYTGLADGRHTFHVVATDPAGNVDASEAGYSWTVDTTPPETTLTGMPAALSNSSAASFSFTSENGATFTCKLDTGAAADCVSPASLSGLADGGHTFAVFATDAAGNADPSPASYTWTVDTTPPDTSITATPSSPSSSSSATFGFASEAGATFRCKLDGGAFESCVSTRTFTGLADGSHTFQVYATDTAGNADPTPASFTWTISTTSATSTACLAFATSKQFSSIAVSNGTRAIGELEYESARVSFHGRITSGGCNAAGTIAVFRGSNFTLTLTEGSARNPGTFALTTPTLNVQGQAAVTILVGRFDA